MKPDYGRPRGSREGMFGSRAAFTLVELLVVMAIVSVLAAMLLPALSKTRETAMQTQCASRQKQVSLGALQYTDEYAGSFFPCRYTGKVSSCIETAPDQGTLCWANLLKVYVGDTTPDWGSDCSPIGEIFTCPKLQRQPCSWNPKYLMSSAFTGMSYNNYGLGNSISGWRRLIRMAQIRAPSSIFIFAEGVAVATWDNNKILGRSGFDDGTPFHFRHQAAAFYPPGDGSMNAAYVDGHVRSLRAGEVGRGWSAFYNKAPYMESQWPQ